MNTALFGAIGGPFSRLFIKLFLWFWLAMLMVSLVSAYLVTELGDSDKKVLRRLDHIRYVNLIRSSGGVPDVCKPDVAGSLLLGVITSPPRCYVINERKQEFYGRKLPKDVVDFFEESKNYITVIKERKGNFVYVGPFPVNLKAERHWLIFILPHGPKLFFSRLLIDNTLYIRVAALAVTSAIFCIWMAWYLTSPIRALETTARRIAAGDLDARAPRRVLRRDDEVGVLGKEFNAMAEQLKSLIHAQQRFLRDASHELRSPLTRLKLALGIARNKAGEVINRELDRIELEQERLEQLISEIIEVSRPAVALKDNVNELVDLNVLLNKVVENAKFEAESQGKQIVVNTIAGVWVRGKENLLASAIDNVVRNAIRYTEKDSSVEVKVELDRKAEPQWVKVIISDHGPGVPHEDLEKLFHPFYRVQQARDRKTGGSGLGLAIAERAVRIHQGEIMAENRAPHGLRVTISLPVNALKETNS